MIYDLPFRAPRFALNTNDDAPEEVKARRLAFARGPMGNRALPAGEDAAPHPGGSPEEIAEAFGRAMFARCGKDWTKMIEIARGAAIRAQGDAMGGAAADYVEGGGK